MNEDNWSDSEDESLPDPVTEETPFEFGRVLERVESLLKFDSEPFTSIIDVGDHEEFKVWYDVILLGGFVRKLVRSSGDIWYEYKDHVKWIGTEAGVCDECMNSDSIDHPVSYRCSIRTYPDVRTYNTTGKKNRWRTLCLHSSINKNKDVCVYMQHGGKVTSLPVAVRRNERMRHVHEQIQPKHLKGIVSIVGKHPTSRMSQKNEAMAELHGKCLCGEGYKKSRVWLTEEGDNYITETDLSEAEFRQTHRVSDDEFVVSFVRQVQRPCKCLCPCGHRNPKWPPQ